jgi:hypothetical protein
VEKRNTWLGLESISRSAGVIYIKLIVLLIPDPRGPNGSLVFRESSRS